MNLDKLDNLQPNVGATTSEPNLYYIIMHYYLSHGIDKESSEKYTKLYIQELKRLLNP